MTDFTEPLVDIGANLTNRQFQRDLPSVLRRAHDAGLRSVLLTGTSMRASRDALQLVARHQPTTPVQLFTTVGVHPHDAKDFDEVETLAEMRKLITSSAPGVVVAVGECGLDFNRDFSPRDKQERVFRLQLELACELQLPLFLHERDAHDAFVRVLTPFVQSKRLPPVVVHCFTGSESEMRTYLSMGFYIGLTGFVCMESRGHRLRTFASRIPLERLMIETDAPFMYPYGNNSRQRCEPKDLRAVVHTLAACYRASAGEIAAATTRNARRFFALESQFAQRRPAVTAASAAAASPSRETPSKPRQAHKQRPAAVPPPAPPSKPEPKAQQPPPPTIPLPADGSAIVLDGGGGEGGGQVIRVAMALAGVLRRTIHVHSIRAGRKVPGLRNQHVRTVELAQRLTGARLDGVALGSSHVVFDGSQAALQGGKHDAVSETGGSVALMIQGSLPAMLFATAPSQLMLQGGTEVGFSPPVDFMQVPLMRLLGRMGVPQPLVFSIETRGFFPAGRGLVRLEVEPLRTTLAPVDLTRFSREIASVFMRVTVSGAAASEELGQQFVAAMRRALQSRQILKKNSTARVESDIVVDLAASTGHQKRSRDKRRVEKQRTNVSILVVVETATGGVLSVDRTDRDTPEYAATRLADELARLLESEVCVDEHLADNSVLYLALANGVSRLRVPAKAQRKSQHLETALSIASRLTGATFEIEETERNAVVTVHGIGLAPPLSSA
ncbi:hypothetical protein P43SY_002212 [Pythium insidiosum]|uniref:RNA 3'-terminal phosphate cyclase domain-containing protein n=1 Tax=Pythium insidiosum TaxID=114742 RepID=A0AAD5QEV8_PYTIN|nr:hypothetical protein P43SY_002212 [Pythium insidiosum]